MNETWGKMIEEKERVDKHTKVRFAGENSLNKNFHFMDPVSLLTYT